MEHYLNSADFKARFPETGQDVKAIIANPPDELVLRAIGDAEVATFSDRTALAKGLTAVREALGPLGDVAIPFARTPGNAEF